MVRKFSDKSQKGQFFTKNSDYILQGFEKYIKGKTVSDPFAGGRDLMNWAQRYGAKKVIGFEIDKRLVDDKTILENDSLNNPKTYKFVITNPPYLHKNKASSETKSKYFHGANRVFEDLYQISIKSILDSEEGIMIVPLNFLSADNSSKIRKIFFDKFKIVRLNIFHEKVFEDTTYNVIAFYYKRKKKNSDVDKMLVKIFPANISQEMVIKKGCDWKIGGDFSYQVKQTTNALGIYRLTEEMLIPGNNKVILSYNNINNKKEYELDAGLIKLFDNNIILLRAIDSKNHKKIQLEDIRKYGVSALVGKNTSRNMAYLIFKKQLDIARQEKLIYEFNKLLGKVRKVDGSFFLTNFRDNNRKRIGFEFVYKMINYTYSRKSASSGQSFTSQQSFNFSSI